MTDTKPQIWDVPISHEQRFALFQLAFHREATVDDGAAGKSFRRMARAFGLSTIRDAFKRQGAVPIKAITSSETRLFKVTAENISEVLTKLAKRKRSTGDEMVIGDLFDVLEDAQTNGQREEWLAVPRFDEAEDAALFALPDDKGAADITCPSCGQHFDPAETKAAAPASADAETSTAAE
jgi:hypothetical protein